MQKQYLPMRGRKLLRFMGGSIGPRMEIFETSGIPIPVVPRLHQSNGYIRKQLRVWIAQKCIVLDGAETVLTTYLPQTTPFQWGQYSAGNGNMRDFDPLNPHSTEFALKQLLYQKEATGMESSKIYYRSRCRNTTYKYGTANYHV